MKDYKLAYILATIAGIWSLTRWGINIGEMSTRIEYTLFSTLLGFLLGAVIWQTQKLRNLSDDITKLKESRHIEKGAAAPAITKPAHHNPPFQATGEPQPLELDFEIELTPDPATDITESRLDSLKNQTILKQSGPIDQAIEQLKGFFTRGNLLAKTGVILLFFGISFLLKYAADHAALPIEFRLAGVALGGTILLITGWRLRLKKPTFSLTLQGGAVGILYLTVFASLRLYDVIPHALAFGLLLLFVGLSTLLALLQNSRSLAVLATAGGFLAPVLTSTGDGSHIALFSYYLILNSGILAIAWFRAWRILNLIGFGFTFVIASLWGAQYYQPEFFTSTEPFLVAFFLMYTAIAVLFALRQPPNLKGVVDGSLVFGVPLATAVLQGALVVDWQYGLAFSAITIGGYYLLLAMTLFKLKGRSLQMLSESFLATGIVFSTLAIPFALEGSISAAFWALEGAAMVWLGIRQQRLTPRVFGVLLQLMAGLIYIENIGSLHGTIPLISSQYLGAVLIAFSGLFSAYYLERHPDKTRRIEQKLAPLFFAWGIVWWLGANIDQIDYFLSSRQAWNGLLVLITITALASQWLKTKLNWERLNIAVLGLLPASALVALLHSIDQPQPTLSSALPGWTVALASIYGLLHSYNDYRPQLIRFWHAGSYWLVTFLLTNEAAWRADNFIGGSGVWGIIPWGLTPLVMMLIPLSIGQKLRWPMTYFSDTYTRITLLPIALYLLCWAMFGNAISTGSSLPLQYLPVINPLDLTILFILYALFRWWQQSGDWLKRYGVESIHYLGGLAGALFLWLNAATARTVHHWGDIPFTPQMMFDSQILQTAISVIWSLVGLGSMLVGSRIKNRPVWLIGAALMVLVVSKLFLVDLSSTGTVARIVSFMGVGALMLVVGYFSPAPPKQPGNNGVKE
ncbi:MAG: DUF2339 domain-containing protein [Gammaproteobacteria bacterium]|nr:DUF2339 domain-containing protein [Gammaproteobacteria bacterium]